jgi:hypothetical protein
MSTDSDYQKAYQDAKKKADQFIQEYCEMNPGNSPTDDFSDIPEVTTLIEKAYTEACKNHGIDIKSDVFERRCLWSVWELAGHKTR